MIGRHTGDGIKRGEEVNKGGEKESGGEERDERRWEKRRFQEYSD